MGLRLPWMSPVDAFRRLADAPGLVFLDSGGQAGDQSRFSYVCLDPFSTLRVRNGAVLVDGRHVDGDAFTVLACELARHRHLAGRNAVPFSGGAAGFIGYDMGATLEPVARAPGALAGIPDMLFGFFDTVLAFDHDSRALFLFAPDSARQDAVLARLSRGFVLAESAPVLAWRAMVSRGTHMDRVRQALRLIEAGDIYQANIAAAFEAARPDGMSAAALYLALRAANPAPFSAYIDAGDGCAVLSVSPERFFRVAANGEVETRPIKGTRPRGADAAQDAAQRAALLSSAKDRAENLMIVDLLRNDLSRVADGVEVASLCALESFAHVHHLVSSVRARMRPGLGPVDVLRAAFPGGSVTGVPKMRAMDIIADLEGVARGPYCGSAAWIGFDGAMDSNILIRSLTVARDRVVARAGGGIVADSDPAAEWEEALVKIMPLLRATGTVAA
jgi:para-aminobenzoate synthetase component 1